MSFEVKVAERQGARLLIQLSGVSGSGKTYTALHLALGLAGGDGSKVLLIDTENRRGSLYANCLPDGKKFKVIDFYAPFSPERYCQAIDAAVKAGAEVIVIDSVTHEWEGPGGCQEIANATKFPDWKRAKKEHKDFMTHMLQSSAHIIACTRAREKTDFTDTKNPVSLGIQPIQEQNFSFEATVSLMMQDQGRRQDVLKCPEELREIMGRGQGYIGVGEGAALRSWVDGGVPVDPAIEHWRGVILNSCEAGEEALKTAWQALPKGIGGKLGKLFLEQCKASAAAYDRQREQADDDGEADLGSLTRAAEKIESKREEAQPEPAPVQQPEHQAEAEDDNDFFNVE